MPPRAESVRPSGDPLNGETRYASPQALCRVPYGRAPGRSDTGVSYTVHLEPDSLHEQRRRLDDQLVRGPGAGHGQRLCSRHDGSRCKYRDDLSGKLDTSGTSTAYTLTSNQTFTSLSDGIQIAFRLDEANGASPTLNVDSLGAKPLRLASGADLAGAELTAGSIYTATYDVGGDEWLINDPAVSAQQIPRRDRRRLRRHDGTARLASDARPVRVPNDICGAVRRHRHDV